MGALKCYYCRIVSLTIVLLYSCSCFSQESEYEYVNISSWKWREHKELQYLSNSISKLQVYNSNAETEQEKKSKTWTRKTTWLSIPSEKGKAYTIMFNIRNDNNPRTHKFKVWGKDKKGRTKEMWHKTDIYWGLIFQCEENNKEQEFDIDFCDKAKSGGYYSNTSTRTSDQGWSSCSDIGTRSYRIEFDGISKIDIYSEYWTTPTKTMYCKNGLSWLGVVCGNAANIIVTNFSFKRKTMRATFLPEIIKAQELLDKQDYDGVVTKMTKVLETYKDADSYYCRALAYYKKGYYRSAIDDCDCGLRYNCGVDLRQYIYFLRGYCKLSIGDQDGIVDMKQAGDQGISFLRENNLLDRKPSNNTQKIKSAGGKIHPNNRIPELKKNK